MSEKNSRWDEIRKIQIESSSAYRILGGIILVGCAAWIGSMVIESNDGYGTNVFTEILGVIATIAVVNTWYHDRDKLRRKKELVDRLLVEVQSTESVIARNALHEMRRYDLLCGKEGLLSGKNMSFAQWKGANLEYINLRGTSLGCADLDGTHLKFARLERAYLRHAKLRDADMVASYFVEANMMFTNLERANLSHAFLSGAQFVDSLLSDTILEDAKLDGASFCYSRLERASLKGADLRSTLFVYAQLDNADLSDACLCGSDMTDASLLGANLEGALFDASTTLPDGAKWSPKSDLSRFTDPAHKCPWRSKHELSPAFHGELNKRFTSKRFWEFNFPRFYYPPASYFEA